MGVGTIAAYGRTGQRLDFFEIDPAVVQIARRSGLFTFLRDSSADVHVVVGDGRLSMIRVPDATYGLIVLDAFSSDAIPAHLLTLEAMTDYRRTLVDGGLLAFHVSNRNLDLVPVLAANAARLGMSGVVRVDDRATRVKTTSTWVVLGRRSADLDALRARPGWRPLPAPTVRPWTDDYTSLFRVLELG
jgi:spermidine synthase